MSPSSPRRSTWEAPAPLPSSSRAVEPPPAAGAGAGQTKSLPDDYEYAVSASSVTPAMAIPGAMPSGGKGKPRANMRYAVTEGTCLIIGSSGRRCPRQQSEYSPFCTLHSCQARNEDGIRCCNKVVDPTYSQICRSGLHRENGRYDELLDIMHHRQWAEAAELFRRKSEEVQCLADFHERFGAHLPKECTSSSSSTTTSPPSATIPLPITPATSREASLQGVRQGRSAARKGECVWQSKVG